MPWGTRVCRPTRCPLSASTFLRASRIGNMAFTNLASLTAVYFKGHAPGLGSSVFFGANNAAVYYLPGTTDWGPTYADRPTALWKPQVQTSDAGFGVRTNQFGFTIAWSDRSFKPQPDSVRRGAEPPPPVRGSCRGTISRKSSTRAPSSRFTNRALTATF